MKATAGIFHDRADTERAARDLAALGIPQEQLTVLAPGGVSEAAAVPTDDVESPGIRRALGDVVGAAAGAAGGIHGAAVLSVLVPGVGPVIAFGVAGAALLGATGAALGAALREGLPRDEIFVYEDALRRGRSVVIAVTEGAAQAEPARDVMQRAGAESVDAARQQWWLGLRSAEEAEYTTGEFGRDKPRYRQGFEATLNPAVRGKPYDDVADELARRHADVYRDEAFRRGYERGRRYDETQRQRVPGGTR